ncbi:Peptidyl-tRNA hydrolase [Hyella patelloides LEGE 07179]|uniref:Peptidyl-tRNA hydrolase n=1 Tax=Hyella patelloides LEGE 07179 TaxID=945734 RepID=A0A563W2B6_9CYAN|nr:aminoacyl-tRNA hydrolase [Hyella patelloides]VEP17816.1 Peptidyl-tRNA hydrolase [Hyella patelloides LEGE 07179]
MTPESKSKIVIPELIVGLGNPEPKYDQTRHNIGFDAVDNLADAWGLSWKENKRFQGLISEGVSPYGNKVRLLKPLTYMNRSGQAVRAVIDWYKISSQSVLVIYDEMDLPIGRLRIRLSGSAGGHNGMKSIISHLANQNFPRLRIGIGKSTGKKQTISHVLGKFAPEEKKVIKEVLQLSTDAVERSLKEGVEKAMSLYNSKQINVDG